MRSIIVFGPMGSGKSTIAKIINEKTGFPVYSLGTPIKADCKKYGKEERAAYQAYGEGMRSIFGREVWCNDLIDRSINETYIVIDDGRQLHEVEYFGPKGFICIGVTACRDIRKQRIQLRDNVTPTTQQLNHNTEIQADFVSKNMCKFYITNNGSLDNLEKEVEKILKQI